MRLIKLAFRIVLEQRRSLIAAAGALVLVSALTTAAGSIYSTVRVNTETHYRITELGEYAGLLESEHATALAAVTSPGWEVSLQQRAPGVIAVGDQLIMTTIARSDLARERSYLELPEQINPKPGDALLVTEEEGLFDLSDRIVRVATTDAPTELLQIDDVFIETGPTVLLIHDPELPNDAMVHARIYGRGRRINARDIVQSPAAARLQATGWRRQATLSLRALRRRIGFLLVSLGLIASAVLIPGQLVLARRVLPAHRLLATLGYSDRSRSAVIVFCGAALGAIASAGGALIGMVGVSLANATERVAIGLLPFTWRSEIDLAIDAVATPSMGWAVTTIVTSTLLAAVTAFPTVPFVATLISRRSLWS